MHSKKTSHIPAPRNLRSKTWRGRYSNAETAGSSIVGVKLTDRGVVIEDMPDATEPLVWPYGALSTDTPITIASGEALLNYKHMPGATLYVDDGGFVKDLCQSAKQLTTRSHRWRWAGPALAAAAIIVAVFGAVWLADLKPARTIAGLMPHSAREAFGTKVVAFMTKSHAVCVAPEGKAALDKLARRLMPTEMARKNFRIIAVDWSLVNAFAAPGGQIVITRGLILAAKTPDEVAGILAHEIGHGLELHPEAGMVRTIGLSAALDLIMGGSSGTAGGLAGLLIESSYSRNDERAADLQGLRLMKRAKISQQGLSEFFARLAKKERGGFFRKKGGSSPLDLVGSHPRSGERARLIDATARYPSTPALSPTEWRELRNICRMKSKRP